MPEEEIEKKVNEPDVEPVPGLGEAPAPEGDDDSEGDGYVCMPADLVKE